MVVAAREKEAVRDRVPHRRELWVVGTLAAIVLVLTADYQIYDNNFYSLSEATNLLAGDHPYRDFFEWGVPLQAALSVVMQVVTGHRLIGEFLLQWTLMVAGVVMAFHLAVRLSHSVTASLLAFMPALLNLAATPTVHNSKLFVYPAALLLMWRYLDCPGPRRSAVMGGFAAVAFFFRHDHGVYVGAGMLLAFALARVADPASRSLRSVVTDAIACALGAAVLIVPWAIVVERSEGLLNYVQARAYINEKWHTVGVFDNLLTIDPRRPLIDHDNAQRWLMQISIVIASLSLATAGLGLLRRWYRREAVPLDTLRLLAAGALLTLVEHQLFREAGYFVIVAPLTAALGARFLAGSTAGAPAARYSAPWLVSAGTRALAAGVLGIALIAVGGFVRESRIFQTFNLARHLPETLGQLAASPPIDGLVDQAGALRIDRARWLAMPFGDRAHVMLRYMHDCVAEGDRVLVSGQTPYQVNYYVGRPFAGGHLYWHDQWRAEPALEAQSLGLLQQQAVPFAFATHDPVLNDLKPYPHIREFVLANYVALEGSEGYLLVDRRRAPTGQFGALGFPCFR